MSLLEHDSTTVLQHPSAAARAGQHPAQRVSAAKTRVLVITPFEDPQWRWLAPYFADAPITWEFRNLDLFGRKQHHWLAAAWRVARAARQCDVVISHAPYMTLYLALALRARGIRTPHWAFSFNHGNKRFFRGLQRSLARHVLQDVDLFCVYCEAERRLFHDLYRIPLEKLAFQHWAVQPPVLSRAPAAEIRAWQPYICCLGRNNRDFATFLTAVDGLALPADGRPVRVVVVCPADALRSYRVPPNVIVRSNISMTESMDILAGAALNIVPIQDAATGAGHITIVAAMQLGLAQVVTGAETIRDYFFDGVHGLCVPPQSAPELRTAIAHLLDAPAERAAMGAAARTFADRWLSEAAAARSLARLLDCHCHGAPYPLAPPDWVRD